MSERESFGLTVLEAVAAGARVVASDIPPHRETAAHGGEGRSLFVPADAGADALAAAIGSSLRAGRPAGAPAEVLSWDAMAGDMADAYRSLRAAGSPRRGRRAPLTDHRALARAHGFLVTGASGAAERIRVLRFVARQVARRAGLRAGRDDAVVRFRGTAYVVAESAELHTLVELYRDGYYSRAPAFLPRPGTTVVDVGANVGVFTLFHASAGADVLALEPNRGAYERLTRSVAANGLQARVRHVNAAGGASPGWGRLDLEDGLSVLGNVVADEGPRSASPWDRVEIVTLDEVVARHGIETVDLLKVDVEGAESDVLAGGRAMLATVRRVILEYHSAELLAEVRGLLTEAGLREVLAFPASGDGAGMLYAERPSIATR
jgi:FkbM family methyltransferase